MKILYENDAEACSFPYHFEIEQDETTGQSICVCISYVYKNLNIDDSSRDSVNEELGNIPTIKGSHYELDSNMIIYRSERSVREHGDGVDNEVDTRRSFIEDYLETADAVRAIARRYGGKTCKTEFIIDD